MKVFFTGLLMSLLLAVSVAAQEKDITDTWWNEEGTSQIRIFKATDGKFYGKIEFISSEPDRSDVNNPDPAKRDQPLMGLIILRGFEYDPGSNQWTGGTVYDPDNGKTYDCYMWFEGDNNVLHLKGYVLGMKFVGRETAWKRVK